MAKKSGDTKEYIWGERRNNKKWIYLGVAVAVIAGVFGYIIFGFNPKNSATPNGDDNSDSGSQPALVRRAIDGVYVPADQANHNPVAVMIENLVVSRPHSGLAQANLVYEALVEGGITRFMAVYAGELITVPKIGPIRSARPYYLAWVSEFDAMYMHAGGSPQAMSDIRQYDIFDFDQFYNSQYYWRDQERLKEVAVEHTLYSSGEKIAYARRDRAAPANGDYEAWTFKNDTPLADRPLEEKSLVIDFSSFNYRVEYHYDREKNDYLRYQAGEIHSDDDGTEIRAKNIIVQKVNTYLVDDQRLGMDTTGEGEAIIFIDGQAITGKWQKDSRQERTIFYDENGDEVEFNAGTIWIEVVPTDREIEYN